MPAPRCSSRPSLAADGVVTAPAPKLAEPVSGHSETAIFAGGCFWGVQGVFAHVKGVTSTTAGYTGGKAATAEYETVSGGNTGHAESVKVVFDPTKVNYADLLRIYFSVVTDPTEVDRQGPDEGLAISLGAVPAVARPGQGRARLYRAARRRARLCQADCDQARAGAGLLSGRGLSPELHGA